MQTVLVHQGLMTLQYRIHDFRTNPLPLHSRFWRRTPHHYTHVFGAKPLTTTLTFLAPNPLPLHSRFFGAKVPGTRNRTHTEVQAWCRDSAIPFSVSQFSASAVKTDAHDIVLQRTVSHYPVIVPGPTLLRAASPGKAPR